MIIQTHSIRGPRVDAAAIGLADYPRMDLGEFNGSLNRELPLYGAGLVRVTGVLSLILRQKPVADILRPQFSFQ